MLHSLALWLRLALMRFRRPDPALREALELPRPEGALIWVQIGAGAGADTYASAEMVLERLHRLRPDLRLMMVCPKGPERVWPEGVLKLPQPDDTPQALGRVLAHLRPALIVLLGNDLPAALIAGADAAGIPVMLADAHLAPLAARRGVFARLVQRALLRRLSRILVRDRESIDPLLRLGAEPKNLAVGGVMGLPPEPLACSEAERASMAALIRHRPVWLAAAVPPSETGAVVAAHERARRHAHRMLLLLAPDAAENAAALASRLQAAGWTVTRRSREGEPDDETEIFLADDPADFGLWYRIAPVSYMGGTLSGAVGHARSPLEPAALGSAILHGPQTAPFAADYIRLDEARAARLVHDEAALGEAVSDLMAPDRAAVLAHNAWAVTSGGAAAAETVVRALVSLLHSPPLGKVR